MNYEKPVITDHGSIAAHTFSNTGEVGGTGPSGKDPNGAPTTDKFGEPSNHGLS